MIKRVITINSKEFTKLTPLILSYSLIKLILITYLQIHSYENVKNHIYKLYVKYHNYIPHINKVIYKYISVSNTDPEKSRTFELARDDVIRKGITRPVFSRRAERTEDVADGLKGRLVYHSPPRDGLSCKSNLDLVRLAIG